MPSDIQRVALSEHWPDIVLPQIGHCFTPDFSGVISEHRQYITLAGYQDWLTHILVNCIRNLIVPDGSLVDATDVECGHF